MARPGTAAAGSCGGSTSRAARKTKIAPLVFNQPAEILADGRISFTRQSRSKNPMVMMEPFPGDDTTSRVFEVVSIAPGGGDERVHALFPPRSWRGQQPDAAAQW